VYAVEAIHDRLVERIVELTGRLRIGDPDDDEKEIGAVTFPRQIEVAEKLLADAKEKGALVRCGGRRLPGPGRFFEPTVVVGATHEMDVMREEIFGPIVPIMRVKTDQEAIDLANDSHLGLAGYVFTKDRDRGRRIAERMRAGSIQVNDTLSFFGVPDAPFGGVKSSGFGRVHGPEGLRELCELHHVHYDRMAPLGREPWWFPYSRKTYRAALKGLPAIFGGGGIVKRIRSLL
jgi:succinate-semialdehyde dehydrogenase/glutarate-semialdehyde dehydrogenase